jgi:hypothetical protein
MPNSEPFLRGYRVLCLPIVDAACKSAWPEIFPPDKIDRLRQTVGPRHFSAQMMLEYIAEEKSRLDPDAIKFYTGEFDLRKAQIQCAECRVQSEDNDDKNMNVGTADTETAHCKPHTAHSITGYAAYWDPSLARRGADASVIALVLRDDKSRIAFIHDVKYLATGEDDPHPFATQCENVLDFMAAYGLRHIAVEVNGIGNALPEILRRCSITRGQPLVIRKIINSAKKETRILDAIEPLLGTGRLYAHERIRATPLVDELADWSPVATVNRDDGLDAVSGALRTPPIAIRPRGAQQMVKARTEFSL